MRAKLKTFGLAACAVFAFSAVVASGASAQVLTTDGNTVQVEGTGTHLLVTDVGAIECETLHAEGMVENESSEFATDLVEYTDCTAFGLEAEIDFNGCGYLFHVEEATESGGAGSVDIVCPAGQEIEFDASGLCLLTFGEQSSLEDIAYTNDTVEGVTDITMHADLSNIEYEYSGFCGSGSNNNGVYEGEATLTFFEDTSHTTRANGSIS